MEFIKVLESFAVIVAALVAIYGISSWRREMKGRKEYELAEEVLTLFYEAKDKISAIRNPLSWPGEVQSRKASPKEKREEKEAFDRAHIFFERYQRHQETFNRLHALHYCFITIFGQDKVKPFDDLNNIVRDILNAATMLGHYWVRLTKTHLPTNEKDYNKLIKDIKKYETVIWAGFDPDPIAPKVESIIEEIEKICEPVLRPEPSWFSKIFIRR